MIKSDQLPPVEDGFPIPPEKPLRQRRMRVTGQSPIKLHLMNVKHGQSMVCDYFLKASIQSAAATLGIPTRSERTKGGHASLYKEYRIWFLPTGKPPESSETKLKERIRELQTQNLKLWNLLLSFQRSHVALADDAKQAAELLKELP